MLCRIIRVIGRWIQSCDDVWHGSGRLTFGTHLGDRCETVGGARRVGHDVSAPLLVLFVVDPHHIHGRVVLGRSRDEHLLCAAWIRQKGIENERCVYIQVRIILPLSGGHHMLLPIDARARST